MANKPSSTRSVVKGVLAFIKSQMPSIVEGYDDFPASNQKLKFPSVSVFTQTPLFVPTSPYVVRKLAKIESDADPNKGKTPVIYCIGSEDFELQLDFWCETKFQRHDIYEELKNAMSEIAPTSGVNLQLNDYFGEWIHVFIGDISFAEDSEISSQRNEWRLKVDVTVNIRALKLKLENLIESVETTVETTENQTLEDASSGTDYLNNTI